MRLVKPITSAAKRRLLSANSSLGKGTLPAVRNTVRSAHIARVKAVRLPAAEVHLTDIDAREPFRRISYVGMACGAHFKGLGFEGYRRAIRWLCGL